MFTYTVVIGKTEQSNGIAVDIDALEITLNKSEELDFGVFTVPATTRFENFQILDRVDITVTDGINTKEYDPFVIIGDKVEPVSKDGYFKHTVSFIENIHKFEKVLSSSLYITQPLVGEKKSLLDVLTHIRNVVPFERSSFLSATRLFNIDNDLATYLDTIDAPQFFFNGGNLRNMLNGVSSFVNAIARLEDSNNLIFSFYNEILATIGIDEDVVHKRLENQTDKYSSTIQSNIENAVSSDDTNKSVVVYPGTDTWVSFRSREVKLTDTSLELRLGYPIERITKVTYRAYMELAYVEVTNNISEVQNLFDPPKVNMIYYVTGTQEYYRYVLAQTPDENDGYVDIVEDVDFEIIQKTPYTNINNPATIKLYWYSDVTPLVLILDQWRRLDLDRTSQFSRDTSTLKINSMYYEIGGITISNTQLGGIFDDVTAFRAFHRRALVLERFVLNEEELGGYSVLDLRSVFNQEVLEDTPRDFRIDYVPYFGTSIRLEKDNIIDHPFNTQISINQGERIVSADRLLNNVYGLAQRTGQDDITVKQFYTDLTESFDLGDITDDNFVVASIHYTYYIKYFLINYQFTRNFNRFTNRIALNQENRAFDIGLGSKTTNRNLHYTEYVEIGTQPLTNNSLVRDGGINVFMNTLRENKATHNKPIHFGTMYDATMPDLDEGEGIFLKTIEFSEGNSLNFYWGFTDILGAGDQIIEDSYFSDSTPNIIANLIQVRANKFIRYTNADGGLDTFEVALHHKLDDDTYDSRVFPVVNLPTTPLIGGHSVIGNLSDPYTVLKDKSESLSMNYQLSVVPNFNYADKIFAGRELVRKNNLILPYLSDTEDYFVFASTTEKYNGISTYDAVGSIINGASYTVAVENSAGKIEVTLPNIETYKSWGISDSEGNLYLGVNIDEEEIDTVYFNFRNRRTGMSYTFDGRNIQRSIAPSITTQTGLTSITININDQQQSASFRARIRDITNNGEYTFQTTTNTQIGFGDLTQSTEYEVGVQAFNQVGFESAFTSRRVFTDGPPKKIEDVYTVVEETGIRVYWNVDPAARAYEIQYKTDNDDWDDAESEFAGTGRNNELIEDLSSNIIYIFRVRGFNEDYVGDFSDEVIGVFADTSEFTVTAIPSSDSIAVTWTEVADSEGYQFRFKEALATNYFTFNFDNPEQVTYTLTGLDELTFYDVSVRVVFNYEGETIFTEYIDRRVQTTETPPPGDLSAPVITNKAGFPTTTEASWTITNNNDEEVNVFYDFNTSSITTTTTARGTIAANSSITATNAGSEGQTRYIAAQFKQTNFNDSAVSTGSQTILVSQPIPAPASVAVSNITASSAYASWSFVSDATNGYLAQLRKVDGTANGVFVDERETGSNSFVYTEPVLAGMSPGNSYFVRVRSKAVGTRAASSYTLSTEFEPEVIAGTPNAPGSLAITTGDIEYDMDQADVPLTWTDNSANETGFRVYRRVGTIGSFQNISGNLAINTTTYLDEGAPIGGSISYYVVAFNANGESPSNTVTQTI